MNLSQGAKLMVAVDLIKRVIEDSEDKKRDKKKVLEAILLTGITVDDVYDWYME